MGRLLENAVFLELYRRHWSDPRYEIHYWTDGKGEVDFVVSFGQYVVDAIQVCYDISDPLIREREVSSLIRTMKKLKAEKGIIVTGFQYDEVFRDGFRIEIIPYWEWERRESPTMYVF